MKYDDVEILKRKNALCDELGLDEETVMTQEEAENTYYDNICGIPFYTSEGVYLVATEDEADAYLVEDTENLIDECGGLEALFGHNQGNLEYIYNNFVEWNNGEDYMREDYESYYNDIESESSSKPYFKDRLQEELFEKSMKDYDDVIDDIEDYQEDLEFFRDWGHNELDEKIEEWKERIEDYGKDEFDEDLINWINDKYRNMNADIIDKMEDLYFIGKYSDLTKLNKINEWFFNYEDNKDDLIEQAVQSIIDEYDSPIEWASDNFGKDFIKGLEKEGDLTIDYEGLSKWVTGMDGYGRIASYDGKDIDTGEYHIFMVDDKCYEKEITEPDRE